MLNFRYSALTKTGEVVSGSIAAASASEVALRIEYLGLIPIETIRDDGAGNALALGRWNSPPARALRT